MAQVLASLENGEGADADLDKLLDICDSILGRAFCPFGDGAISPVVSSIKYFRDEYIEHSKLGGCPFDPAWSTVFGAGTGPSPVASAAGREDRGPASGNPAADAKAGGSPAP